MTEQLTASVETALNAFNEVKTMVAGFDKKLTDITPKLDAFDQTKLNKLEKSIGDAMEESQREKARTKAIEDELAALKVAFNRAPNGSDTTTEDQQKKVQAKLRKALNEFARIDTRREVYFDDFVKEKHADDVEFKALSVGTDPNGGYLVMPEFGGVIQTKVYESSPMRQLARVQPISTLSYEHVLDNDEAASGWVGETGSRTETNTPTLGKITVTAHELYANPRATQTMLDDSMIDIESWLAGKGGEKFGRDEATAFITGSGIAKPRGIMSYTAGTNIAAEEVEQVVSGNASALTYDGLVDLQNALKEPYQRNASFLYRRATNAALLKIKDGEGRPIFNMDYTKNAGLQATLMGQPAYFAADVAALAANALAIAYGDFKQAYLIVDRIGLRLLRDPYSSKPYVSFYMTKRVGGQVVNFEALKIQKIST